MCGITICIKGPHYNSLNFTFNILEIYKEKINQKYVIKESEEKFVEYIEKNNLFISNFSPEDIKHSIANRGPDSFRCIKLSFSQKDNFKVDIQEIKSDSLEFKEKIFSDNESKDIEIICCSSVLNLRGEKDLIVVQPFVNFETNNILLYNGEIYNVELKTINIYKANDKLKNIYEKFLQFDPFSNDTRQLSDLFNEISKYCFNSDEIIDNETYCLLFQTLMDSFNADFSFVYVDVLNKQIIFSKDYFGKRSLLFGLSKTGICISSCSIGVNTSFSNLKQEEEEEEDSKNINNMNSSSKLEKSEEEIIKKDFLEQKYNNEYIMALNKTWIEIPCGKYFNMNLAKDGVKVHKKEAQLSETEEVKTEFEESLDNALKKCTEILIESHKTLLQNIFPFKDYFKMNLDVNFELSDESSSLAILFSGGLDSSLLALISGMLLPKNAKIDLLNIAFKQDAPDRDSGIKSYLEIKEILPHIRFNLVLIDKTLDQTKEISSEMLNLIYPKMTHMDYNISTALHLASKGEGYLYENNNNYKSEARIILSGLGADEIFGGYSRYRVAFLRGGFDELHKEMNFDLHRLWIRNLGRDDRSISSNGKEVRFPFLNQKLIEYVQTIDKKLLTNFNMPRGTGDKILLRKIAEELGLKQSQGFKKRAIQFGTRLAKLSNIDTFGSNRKAKGTAAYIINNK